jgi:integrase
MKRGTVYKRGTTSTYVVDIGPDGGQRRQRSKGGFSTKRDALAALNQLQSSLASGSHVEPTKLTVAAYLRDEWLPSLRSTGKRATTLRSYEMHLRVHVEPHIGSERLQGVTGAKLNAFYGHLLASGRSYGRGGLSAATVRRCHAMLHKAFADAVRWNRLIRNPADAADPPKQHGAAEAEMATWTAAELGRFLDQVRDDRLFALWLLLALSGMRRGEALGLRWEDADLAASRLSVTRALVAVGYDVRVSEPKTRRGRRSIALDPATVAALHAWRVRQTEERLALGPAWIDTGLVFTRENGSHIHPDRATKVFDSHVRRSGLARIRLHDLRHTHATLALAAGFHPKVVSERLGHATVSLTLDVHSHAIPALQEDAAATVAALVLGR